MSPTSGVERAHPVYMQGVAVGMNYATEADERLPTMVSAFSKTFFGQMKTIIRNITETSPLSLIYKGISRGPWGVVLAIFTMAIFRATRYTLDKMEMQKFVHGANQDVTRPAEVVFKPKRVFAHHTNV